MAQDVQQLLLKIDASTELARRELRKMDGDFDSFTKRSEAAAGAAEGAFGRLDKAASFAKASIVGFAAGIGIDGIISLGRTILEAADNLDAAAEKAGLSTTRYQTLKESLRSLEVEGDKVDAIFGRLTDTLGAVQGGTAAGGVEAALDKMGVRSRILNGEITTTDGLLDAIAASAGKFSTQAEFTASVIDIVGKKLGVDLANALKDGGAALKQGEADFTSAGGVVEAEYIAKLADANEAIDRFTANSKSQLIIWAGQTIGLFKSVGKAVADFEAAEDAAVLRGIDKALGVAAPKRVAAGNGDAKERAAASLAQLAPGSALYASLAADYARKFGEAPPIRDEAAITVTASRVPRGSGRGNGARVAAPARRAGVPTISDADNRTLGFDTGDFSGALVDGNGRMADVAEQLDGIRANLGEINVAAVDLANADILNVDALFRGNMLLRDASQSITDAILGATSLGDALVNTFARAGAALIENSLFDLLTGQFGNAGGLAGKAGKLLGFANGGRPPVGVASIVGERGPELFVPRVPGTIIPNHKLGGGGGTSVYNDFRGAVVTEELYARIDATGQRAAQAGALGGRQLAAADNARRARRRMA
jgi:hypothetical protein